jgi:hypothetical protein
MISTIETCSPGGDIHVFFPESKMEGRIVEWCEGPQQHQLKRKTICNTEWRHRCMYPKVPMTRVVTWVLPEPKSLANPKSETFAFQVVSTRMLLDLMSRCTTFGSKASCKYAKLLMHTERERERHTHTHT